MQPDVQRGQSFNFDSNRPLIYYYSVLKPFPETIIPELILCQKIKPALLKSLPQEWYTLAAKTASVERNNEVRYLSWNFILDTFIYSWLNSNEQSLQPVVEYRLSKFRIVKEKLEQLCFTFTRLVKEITSQIMSNYNENQFRITYDNACVQPLVIFREKIREEERAVVQMIDQLKLDDNKSESTNLSTSQVLDKKVEVDRSKSDIRDLGFSSQMGKMKKFTKSQFKMSENIFDLLLENKFQDEQWQLAKQFVVVIYEMSIKGDSSIKQYEKVRFIQPATGFYRKALQIWMLEKSISQQKLIFNQFICKAKHFYGSEWNENLMIPLFVTFQQVESIVAQLIPKISDPIQLIVQTVFMLKDKLIAMWDSNYLIQSQ